MDAASMPFKTLGSSVISPSNGLSFNLAPLPDQTLLMTLHFEFNDADALRVNADMALASSDDDDDDDDVVKLMSDNASSHFQLLLLKFIRHNVQPLDFFAHR